MVAKLPARPPALPLLSSARCWGLNQLGHRYLSIGGKILHLRRVRGGPSRRLEQLGGVEGTRGNGKLAQDLGRRCVRAR